MPARFANMLRTGAVLYVYLCALVCAGALTMYIFPVDEILSGLLSLVGLSAFSGVVSFAQWILAEDMIKYAFAFIFAAPVPLAALGSLLFAGALGSFAARAQRATDFPAAAGTGFLRGYQKRTAGVFILSYATLALVFLLAFVWVVAAIPLAIIYELSARGAAPAIVYYLTLAVTALVVYVGLLFLRTYPISFLPSLYSDSHKPVITAFSFAGHNFFRLALKFFVTDVIFACAIVFYYFLDKSFPLLVINCVVASALVFFLLFAAFDEYAADGYGFFEPDNQDGYS